MTDQNPVTLSGLLLTLAIAVVAVAAYYFKLTPEEVALWGTVLTALSALLHWWLSKKTIPSATPVDDDGTPLVRLGDGLPSAATIRAGYRLVRKPAMGPRGATTSEPADLVTWVRKA